MCQSYKEHNTVVQWPLPLAAHTPAFHTVGLATTAIEEHCTERERRTSLYDSFPPLQLAWLLCTWLELLPTRKPFLLAIPISPTPTLCPHRR